MKKRKRRTRALLRGGGGRMGVDFDCLLIIRRAPDGSVQVLHTPRAVSGRAVRAIEAFITRRPDDDHIDALLRDVELAFPNLSFRDFVVGFARWSAAEAMLRGEDEEVDS
jgi:hypothetical protein